MLQDVKYYLERCFAIKDLGEASYILGIKIDKDRSRRLIGLCQSTYIEKILKRYHMEDSKRGKHNKLIPTESRVSCYTDAGYLTDANDLKSQTRYVFILNGGVVDWKSAKQSIFATSSAEAEYIAAYDASKEAVWVRKFISELGVVPTIKEPITFEGDSKWATKKDDKLEIMEAWTHRFSCLHRSDVTFNYSSDGFSSLSDDELRVMILDRDLAI
ncbi:hypothetical protein Tco_1141073 [Tanacetum coccineum]